MVDFEGLDLRLAYLSHDARRIVDENCLKLNLYWQVKLIELCYNFNDVTVATTIKGIVNKNPGFPSYEAVKQAMIILGRRKQHNGAVFSQRAMANLYRLDKSIMVTDYTVRLDSLALVLDGLDEEGIVEIMSGPRCGMNLILLKIEEYVGARERDRRESDHHEPFKPVAKASPSIEAKRELKQIIEDMKSLKEHNG
jgi:hypothetical protein